MSKSQPFSYCKILTGNYCIVRGKQKRLIIPKLTDIAGYKAMFRDFFHALRQAEEPQMNLELAQQDLELIESVYQSV